MRLKPLLFLAGVAGAVVAARKRGGGAPPIPDAVTDAASRVSEAVPQPVKDAAQSAGETVQRAVQSVAPGDGGDDQPQERYEPPAEGLAQQPTTAGGTPSDIPPVTPSDQTASSQSVSDEPGLHTPSHEPPEGAVMPDISDDDPLVREAENAAAADAGSIGGNVDQMAIQDESFPTDPATRPVVEGAGDENEETFEKREGLERSHRETET
jgi:hypothetical protein